MNEDEAVDALAGAIGEGRQADGETAGAEPEGNAEAEPGTAQGGVASPPPPAAPTETLESVKAAFEEYKKGDSERSRAEAVKILRQIADANPEAAKYIYGQQAQTPTQTPAQHPSQAMKDPVAARLDQIETQQRQLAQQQFINLRVSQMADESGKYPKVFENEHFGDDAARALYDAAMRNPKADVAGLAKQVADAWGAKIQKFEESIRKSYVGTKQQAAAQVPAGAGKGGGVPPGAAPKKLGGSFGSKDHVKALADVIRVGNKAEEE